MRRNTQTDRLEAGRDREKIRGRGRADGDLAGRPKSWREILGRGADLGGRLLYPPRCPVCDQVMRLCWPGICPGCMRTLKYVTGPKCFRCGRALDREEQEYCRDCRSRPHRYIRGRALYEYRSAAPSLYRFKYGGRREYAAFFGEEMAFYLGDFIRQAAPQALVPVPMYPAKERRRGYNQAALLAGELGKRLDIPVYADLVRRIRNTRPLKELNPEERLNNLKKAFILRENGVKLETAMIVDDIYTTGTTVDQVALALEAGGVRNIYFVALAIGAGL